MLARLAYNYRWAWDPDGPDVFRTVDPDRWERVAENPVKLLQEAATERLVAASQDEALLARAAALEERVSADLARPAHEGPASPERPIAYFSAEFGFHGSFPIYSGGLGALAGDILKEASDRAWPLVAIGLLYRNGYFRQRIDAGGWQHEYWVDTDPDRLPAALVTGDDGEPLTVTVPVGDVAGRGADLAHRRRPRAAVPARRRPARELRDGALDHEPPVRRRRGHAARAVRAARRRRRAGARGDRASSRASCTSTRATRRSSRSSSRAASRAATAR